MTRPVGPFTLLNRPPRTNDPREWARWYQQMFSILTGAPGIAWDVVSKEGATVGDVEAFLWERNQNGVVNTAIDYTAVAGEHISVTCSTKDVTITLPDATLEETSGMPIWVHKTDATAWEVKTAVKDIKFQNSTMHLISNGIDWVIS